MSPHLTALRCLFLVALHHGVQVPPEKLGHADESDTEGSLLQIFRDVGMAGKVLRKRKWVDLTRLGSAYPIIVQLKDSRWVIVASVMATGDGRLVAAVLDPQEEQSGLSLVEQAVFLDVWDGTIILAKRKHKITDDSQPFGFTWFLPEIMRNARYLRDTAVTSMMINIISFSTPLFFSVMIDKVVPHHSYNTLFAVILTYVLVTMFEGVFNYVKQNLMVIASNKIDARLASRTFSHLLRLPMHYFDHTSSGVLIRHMQQTESVRAFLTGRLFSTLLDTAALPILLVGLGMYSAHLTLVVVLFSAAIAGVIGVMIPAFRGRLEQLYTAEGARQGDLVETIHGMRAVKSLALESARVKSWDAKVAASVRRRATVGSFMAIASTLTHVLEKLMQISVLAIGVVEVFDGTLSLGTLVAFNMLSGRVSGPLVSIVSLINEYQQTALAVKMLGQVMNYPPERDPLQRGTTPAITGQMEFDQVTFRYEGVSSPALDRISFRVEEGQMIGIVGRSGSGKTTLTRLMQAIHTPQEGVIRLNGNDLRHIDLAHLRRSMGVVLQDNFLFRGTLRDNISAGRPEATMEEVVEVARLAGAAEFIDRLPQSYDTLVEENASNFSGGQRQRIAIARALLPKPRLLLFDEATSALDPESEAIVQNNLDEMARGRTLIIVSHRLSSLVRADAILVMDQGMIIDYAPHQVLLQRCDIYRHLWDQQTRHIQ
jgi:ATP-binding cassette subfamily B protein